MNYSMELPFNLAKPNDYLAKYNLVVSSMHVYTVYVRIYGTPILWSFLGGWGVVIVMRDRTDS